MEILPWTPSTSNECNSLAKNPDDAEFLKGYFTHCKLKLFKVWDKSNDEFERNNYLN
jgi:hypothetical protein